VPVIVSILGESPEDAAAMAQRLDGEEAVAAVELNLSCPNITRASSTRMVAQDPDETSAVVQAARARLRKPLIAKLSPDVTDLRPIAPAAEHAGADALSLVNTFTGMSLDPATRRSRLGAMTGGLSGPAIRPLAVYRVWYTAQTVRLPLIGLGGIVRAQDALEFLLAGASAVAVGTANFADPRAPLTIIQGIRRYMIRHHLSSLEALRGAVAP
jgi:dihydroorotate dehydrogenase (NAD+) catalytic subunit